MDWNYECNNMKSAYFTWKTKYLFSSVIRLYLCPITNPSQNNS
jgi:hypothetical protein